MPEERIKVPVKSFLGIQFGVVLIGSVLLLLNAQQNALSFGIGGLLLTLNILISAKVWKWVLEKKLVAVSVFVIVFKYAILASIIIRLFREPWINTLWFCLGIGSFTVSSLIYATVGIKKDVL